MLEAELVCKRACFHAVSPHDSVTSMLIPVFMPVEKYLKRLQNLHISFAHPHVLLCNWPSDLKTLGAGISNPDKMIEAQTASSLCGSGVLSRHQK